MEGYELIGFGPQHKGTAGAGVASAEDTAWTLVNPAGIAKLERRFDLYTDLIFFETGITPRGLIANPRSGSQVDPKIMFSTGAGYLWKRGDYTLSVGNFGGGGTRVHYDRPRSILGIFENADRRSELLINRTGFGVAREFGEGWSLGVALQASVARFRSDAVTLKLRPTRANYEESFTVGVGLGFGVQKDWEQLSIGASYFTRQLHTDHEEYEDLLNYSLDQPAKFQAGLAYRWNDRVELLLDYKFIQWADVSQIGAKGVRGGLGWSNQHLIKGGVRYQVTDRLRLRFGAAHGDSPIDRNNTFMRAPFPAFLETHLTTGFTYALKNGVDLHGSLVYALPNGQRERGQGDIFSRLGRGTEIDIKLMSVAIGASWHF